MTILPLMKAQSLRRAAALLEVLGVYLAGGIVTEQLSRLFGIPLDNPLGTFRREITNAELITASRQLFVILFLQYAGWFLLICVRRRPRDGRPCRVAGFEHQCRGLCL
jgi:hypothetical protein